MTVSHCNQGGGFIQDNPVLATTLLAGAGATAGAVGGHYFSPTIDTIGKDQFVSAAVNQESKKVAKDIKTLEAFQKKGLAGLTPDETKKLRDVLNMGDDTNLSVDLISGKLNELRRKANNLDGGAKIGKFADSIVDGISGDTFTATKNKALTLTDGLSEINQVQISQNATGLKGALNNIKTNAESSLGKIKDDYAKVFANKGDDAKKIVDNLRIGNVKKFAIIGAAVLGGLTLLSSLFSKKEQA